MQFNSYIFLLAFFPAFLIIYFGIGNVFKNERVQKILLIAASLVFYGYANLKCLLLLLGSGLINYIFFKGNKERKKSILILSIIFNLALLFYFKYLNFFISNLNRVFSSDINLVDIFLPLGISFYTFELISFQVDYFKGSIQNSSFISELCRGVTLSPLGIT